MVGIVLFVAIVLAFALVLEFLHKWIHYGLKYALSYLKRGGIALTIGIILLLIFVIATT